MNLRQKLLVSACALVVSATSAFALERQTAAKVVLRAGPTVGKTSVAPDLPRASQMRKAKFKVTYNGFSDEAKKAFQRAVDIWAKNVSSSETITVDATFEPLGSGILGQAGPNFIFRDFPGAKKKDTWYPDALANKLAKQQLNSGPDILASFSSNFPNWHFGADDAPANEYDFTTVVLHELGHGLGFLGAGRVTGGNGTVQFNGSPFIYDRYTVNGDGKSLLKKFPDNSTALADELTSNDIFFKFSKNKRAKLFAPSTFQPGSSYSHFDEATFGAGDPNSLMTPQLGQGETIRKPGPLTLDLFDKLGW